MAKFLSEEARDLRTIAATGVITTLGTAVLLFLIAGPFASRHAFLATMGTGLAVQLCVWALYRYSGSFPFALLAVFAGLFALPSLPGGQWILGAAGLMSFLLLAAETLQSGLKGMLNQASLAVGAAFLFAVNIGSSLNANTADPFAAEQLRQLALNPDTLYFASMSTMFREYGHIATGLHGLITVKYHALAHVLYARMAGFLGIEIIAVYGHFTQLVLAPLIITGNLFLLRNVSSADKNRIHWICFILLGAPLGLVLGWHWDSHFVSESYVIALALLPGPMMVLANMARIGRLGPFEGLLLAAYLPILGFAKISVGVICTSAAVAAALIASGRKLPLRLIWCGILGVAGLIGYFAAKPIPVPRLEPKFYWAWFQERAMRDPSFLHFFPTHFFLAIMVALTWFTLRKEGALNREKFVWIVMIGVASLIGFAALNITIDSSGYYFSNVHVFMALPFIAILLSRWDLSWRKGLLIKWPDSTAHVCQMLCAALLFSVINFYFFWMPESARKIWRIRKATIEHRDYSNPYLAQLTRVRETSTRDYMVYIPKTERAFWDNQDDKYTPWRGHQCIKMPFMIPIVSARPAVFGLPDPAKKCYTFVRGYETYSEDAYLDSSVKKHSDRTVCQEVRRLGFRGFYRISMNDARRVDCLPKG